MDAIDVSLFADILRLGGLGFISGVLAPFAFLLIGYVFSVVRMVVK